MSVFTGSAVALITPLNEDETVNYDKLRELLEFHVKNQTDAVVICGTTGEASILSDEDQIECIRFSVELINHRIPVIAGAGSNETSHAIYLAQESEKVGADAVLVVTPYYNKTTQNGLIAHYRAIAESISIPIILYNVPGRTGLNIAPETCIALSKIKNIVAIKEASGNFSNIAKIAANCGPDFDLYSGNDDHVLPILSLGGKGVISVWANICPKEVHDMTVAYLNGNYELAREIQLKYLDLIEALFIEVNPIPVKTAMNLMGMDVGKCVLPLVDMEPHNLEVLKIEMKKVGLL